MATTSQYPQVTGLSWATTYANRRLFRVEVTTVPDSYGRLFMEGGNDLFLRPVAYVTIQTIAGAVPVWEPWFPIVQRIQAITAPANDQGWQTIVRSTTNPGVVIAITEA